MLSGPLADVRPADDDDDDDQRHEKSAQAAAGTVEVAAWNFMLWNSTNTKKIHKVRGRLPSLGSRNTWRLGELQTKF